MIDALVLPKRLPISAPSWLAFRSKRGSAAVRAHALLFISGQIGRRPDGAAGETVEEQTELALRRIEEILRQENLDPTALVDVTSYHVDIRHNLPEFLTAKQRFIDAPYPSWTIIGVDGWRVRSSSSKSRQPQHIPRTADHGPRPLASAVQNSPRVEMKGATDSA